MGQTGLLEFKDIQKKDELELYVQQRVQKEDSDPVRGLTFLSEGDSPEEVISQYELSGFDIDIEYKEEFIELEVTNRITNSNYENGERIFQGTVYIISHRQEGVYTAFAICDKEFYEKCVKGYIRALPGLSSQYLTTEELQGLFDLFDDQISGDIIVADAVIKSPQAKTDILYLKEKYFHLFNAQKVEEGGFYVDKINFILDGRTSFSGFLSRHGDSRYSGGSSGIYFNYLLDIVGEALVKKGSIFEDKQREYGSREANRLRINYEPGTLQGKEVNYQLIDALSSVSSSSITVYHKNPYMHASILDFEDGSTADIFITSDQHISIIPGFESSKGSLSRICEGINSHFKEGVVSEAKREEPTYEDFFSG